MGDDDREQALTAFLDERCSEGFRVETRTSTHAIIVRTRRSLLTRLRGQGPERLVVEVDRDGAVTASPAEPLRS